MIIWDGPDVKSNVVADGMTNVSIDWVLTVTLLNSVNNLVAVSVYPYPTKGTILQSSSE